ncbi:uncharacterized protein LOC141529057 [Cotesia typhae]|uniref:uncharacterized protein LOC141529057 n=1 Tax=Cotesia typhae TaxID=2053667 RepID=UPI003D685B8E
MKKEHLWLLALIITMLILYHPTDAKKKVVIHVPYRIKKIKHTHTVYKVIPHSIDHGKSDVAVDDKEEFDHFKK